MGKCDTSKGSAKYKVAKLAKDILDAKLSLEFADKMYEDLHNSASLRKEYAKNLKDASMYEAVKNAKRMMATNPEMSSKDIIERHIELNRALTESEVTEEEKEVLSKEVEDAFDDRGKFLVDGVFPTSKDRKSFLKKVMEEAQEELLEVNSTPVDSMMKKLSLKMNNDASVMQAFAEAHEFESIGDMARFLVNPNTNRFENTFFSEIYLDGTQTLEESLSSIIDLSERDAERRKSAIGVFENDAALKEAVDSLTSNSLGLKLIQEEVVDDVVYEESEKDFFRVSRNPEGEINRNESGRLINATRLEKRQYKLEDGTVKRVRHYEDSDGRFFSGVTSSLAGEKFESKDKYAGAVLIGSEVDNILREFFHLQGDYHVTYAEYVKNGGQHLTEKAYNALIESGRNFIAKYTTDGRKVKFLTKNLFIASEEYGIASELDIVIVDEDNRTMEIVDFKTARGGSANMAGEDSSFEPKLTKYRKQISAYHQMIIEQYGLSLQSGGIIAINTEWEDGTKVSSDATIEPELLEAPLFYKPEDIFDDETIKRREQYAFDNQNHQTFESMMRNAAANFGKLDTERKNVTVKPYVVNSVKSIKRNIAKLRKFLYSGKVPDDVRFETIDEIKQLEYDLFMLNLRHNPLALINKGISIEGENMTLKMKDGLFYAEGMFGDIYLDSDNLHQMSIEPQINHNRSKDIKVDTKNNTIVIAGKEFMPIYSLDGVLTRLDSVYGSIQVTNEESLITAENEMIKAGFENEKLKELAKDPSIIEKIDNSNNGLAVPLADIQEAFERGMTDKSAEVIGKLMDGKLITKSEYYAVQKWVKLSLKSLYRLERTAEVQNAIDNVKLMNTLMSESKILKNKKDEKGNVKKTKSTITRSKENKKSRSKDRGGKNSASKRERSKKRLDARNKVEENTNNKKETKQTSIPGTQLEFGNEFWEPTKVTAKEAEENASKKISDELDQNLMNELLEIEAKDPSAPSAEQAFKAYKRNKKEYFEFKKYTVEQVRAINQRIHGENYESIMAKRAAASTKIEATTAPQTTAPPAIFETAEVADETPTVTVNVEHKTNSGTNQDNDARIEAAKGNSLILNIGTHTIDKYGNNTIIESHQEFQYDSDFINYQGPKVGEKLVFFVDTERISVNKNKYQSHDVRKGTARDHELDTYIISVGVIRDGKLKTIGTVPYLTNDFTKADVKISKDPWVQSVRDEAREKIDSAIANGTNTVGVIMLSYESKIESINDGVPNLVFKPVMQKDGTTVKVDKNGKPFSEKAFSNPLNIQDNVPENKKFPLILGHIERTSSGLSVKVNSGNGIEEAAKKNYPQMNLSNGYIDQEEHGDLVNKVVILLPNSRGTGVIYKVVKSNLSKDTAQGIILNDAIDMLNESASEEDVNNAMSVINTHSPYNIGTVLYDNGLVKILRKTNSVSKQQEMSTPGLEEGTFTIEDFRERVNSMFGKIVWSRLNSPGYNESLANDNVISVNIDSRYPVMSTGMTMELPAKPSAKKETDLSKTKSVLSRFGGNKNSDGTKKSLDLGKRKKKFQVSSGTQIFSKPTSTIAAVDWLEAKLPNIPHQVVDGLIEVSNSGGVTANGVFERGVIKISNKSDGSVAYHEAAHAVFALYNTSNQQSQLLDDARKEFGEPDAHDLKSLKRIYPDLSDKDLTDIYYEENLAKGFEQYKADKDAGGKGGFVGSIKRFFEDIYYYLKNIISNNISLDQFYYNIDSGYYADKSLTKENTDKINKAKYSASFSVSEINQITRELANGMSMKLVSRLTDETINDNIYSDFQSELELSQLVVDVVDELYQDAARDELFITYKGDNRTGITEHAKKALEMLSGITLNVDSFEIAEDGEIDSEIEIDEESADVNHWMNKDGSVNPFANTSTTLRTYLHSIPKLDETGAVEIQTTQNGSDIVQFMDNNELFNMILNEVVGSSTPIELKDRMKSLSKKNPNIAIVYNDLFTDDTNLRTKIGLPLISQTDGLRRMMEFSMAGLIRANTINSYKKGDAVAISDAVQNDAASTIIYKWKSSLLSNPSRFITNNGIVKTGAGNFIDTKMAEIREATEVSRMNVRESKETRTLPQAELSSLINLLKQTFDALGLEFDRVTLANALKTDQLVYETLSPIAAGTRAENLYGLLATISQMSKSGDQSIFSRNEKTTKKSIAKMVEHSPFGFSSSYRDPNNKRIYVIRHGGFAQYLVRDLKSNHGKVSSDKIDSYLNSSAFYRNAPIFEMIRNNIKFKNSLNHYVFGAKVDGKIVTEYKDMTNDSDYITAALNNYHNNGGHAGIFFGPIHSDLTTATGMSFLKLKHVRKDGETNEHYIARAVIQEKTRIDEVKSHIEAKRDQNPDYELSSYEKNARKFVLFPFMNNFIERNDGATEEHMNVVNDKLMAHISNYIDGIIKAIPENLMSKIKHGTSKAAYGSDNQEILPTFNEFFKEFITNDLFYNSQMATLFNGDPSNYAMKDGSVVDSWVKRGKQNQSGVERSLAAFDDGLSEKIDAQPLKDEVTTVTVKDISAPTRIGANLYKSMRLQDPVVQYHDNTIEEYVAKKFITKTKDGYRFRGVDYTDSNEAVIAAVDYRNSIRNRPVGVDVAIGNLTSYGASTHKTDSEGKLIDNGINVDYTTDRKDVANESLLLSEEDINQLIESKEVTEGSKKGEYRYKGRTFRDLSSVKNFISKGNVVKDDAEVSLNTPEIKKIVNSNGATISNLEPNKSYNLLSDGTLTEVYIDGANEISDGATYISLDRWANILRKRPGGFTSKHQRLYKAVKSGKPIPADLAETAFEALKMFNFQMIETVEMVNGSSIKKMSPYQQKDAKFLLTREMAKGRKDLEAIMDIFETEFDENNPSSRVDEVVFESAVKTKVTNPMNIKDVTPESINGLINKSKIIYDDRESGIQVNTLGSHDEQRAIGSQILRLIIDNVSRMDRYFIDGKSISGSALIDLYGKSIIYDLNETVDKFKKGIEVPESKIKELNKALESGTGEEIARIRESINETRLNAIKKMSAKLRNKAKSLGLEEDFITQIEVVDGKTRVPLSSGQIAENIETFLFSELRRSLTKVISPGGSMVNRPGVGYDKSLKYVQRADGSLKYMEVAMGAHFAEHLEMFADENGMIDLSDNTIPDELLEGVMYRIPTEEKYSMFKIKIVEFLPSSVGNQIIMHPEALTSSGFDFDIDKLYSIFHNYDIKMYPNEGHLGEIHKFLSENTEGESEMIDENNLIAIINTSKSEIKNLDGVYINEETFDPEDIETLLRYKSIINKKIGLMIQDLKSFGKNASDILEITKVKSGLNNSKARSNARLDAMSAILGSKHHAAKISTPSKFIRFEAAGKKLSPGSFKQEFLTAIGKSQLAKSAMAGTALKGSLSLAKINHSILSSANNNIRINGLIVNNKFVNNQDIGENLSEAIAAILDNQNNPIAYKYNLNENTAGMFLAGIRLGMSYMQIGKFLTNQMVLDAIGRVDEYSTLEDIIIKEETNRGDHSSKPSDLLKYVNGAEMTSGMMAQLAFISKGLNDLTVALLPSSNGVKSFSSGIQAIEKYGLLTGKDASLNNLKDISDVELYEELGYELDGFKEFVNDKNNNYKWLIKMNEAALHGATDMADRIMGYGITSRALVSLRDKFSEIKGHNLSAKEIKYITFSLKSAITSSNMGLSDNQTLNLIASFPSEIEDFVLDNPDTHLAQVFNKSIARIDANDNFKYQRLVSKANLSDSETQVVKQYHALALKKGSKSTNFEEVSQTEARLAKKLSVYEFMTNGYAYNPSTLSKYNTGEFFWNIKDENGLSFSDKLKATENDLFSESVESSDALKNFISQMLRHENDLKILKFVPNMATKSNYRSIIMPDGSKSKDKVPMNVSVSSRSKLGGVNQEKVSSMLSKSRVLKHRVSKFSQESLGVYEMDYFDGVNFHYEFKPYLGSKNMIIEYDLNNEKNQSLFRDNFEITSGQPVRKKNISNISELSRMINQNPNIINSMNNEKAKLKKEYTMPGAYKLIDESLILRESQLDELKNKLCKLK